MNSIFYILGLLLISIVSCNPAPKKKSNQPHILTTTGMIADLSRQIVGDKVQVDALMGPGVDPHLYKATQSDLAKLEEADVIVYNGLYLEGKMGTILEKMAAKNPGKVLSLETYLSSTDLIYHEAGTPDPHIWFDPSLWKKAGQGLATDLGKVWPASAAAFSSNMQAYALKLDETDQAFSSKLSEIPKGQRILVTSHNAFSYFGKRYQWEVRGLQGISTTAEFGLRDITNMVNWVTKYRIKSLFVETSVSAKSIESIIEGCKQKGWEVQVGGNLFSDAMGAHSTPEGTYIGMLTHNINTIVNGLK